MKARKRAGTVGKVLGCALLLVIALFPIYWLGGLATLPPPATLIGRPPYIGDAGAYLPDPAVPHH